MSENEGSSFPCTTQFTGIAADGGKQYRTTGDLNLNQLSYNILLITIDSWEYTTSARLVTNNLIHTLTLVNITLIGGENGEIIVKSTEGLSEWAIALIIMRCLLLVGLIVVIWILIYNKYYYGKNNKMLYRIKKGFSSYYDKIVK